MKQPTPSYSYQYLYQYTNSYATIHVLNMTSVFWLTSKEIGRRHEWFHYIEIAIPHSLDKNKKEGLLMITGGSQQSSPPRGDSELSIMSFLTQSICSAIHQIPNQPIVFESDPLKKSRVEDGILAFAWAHFLNHTDETNWIPRLPMVKSSLLAMDTIQDYTSNQIPNVHIEQFTIAGASKRGWTTWLVGVADLKHRVKSIIPIVIPVVKTRQVLEHTFNSICGWPEAMNDYVQEGITTQLNSDAFKKLTEVIDPFEYNSRLSKTNKYMVNAVGDQFFWPDLSQFSYNELDGGDEYRHLRYVPNADHSLAGTDAFMTIAAYYYGVLNRIEMPIYNFTAQYDSNGMQLTLNIRNGKKPTSVLLWQAFNPKARDFRVQTIGNSAWKSTPLVVDENSLSWRVYMKNPPKSSNSNNNNNGDGGTSGGGYTAFMIEMTFDDYFKLPIPAPLKFTTSAYILPQTFPCKY
nr:unnamed protein product [Naegleria fowleri]